MRIANLEFPSTRGGVRLLTNALIAALCLLSYGLTWAINEHVKLPSPKPGSFETIIDAKSNVVQVFSYPGRQPIFVIDFPTLSEQGRMFNRVGALIERMGLGRARVLDDKELGQFIRSIGKNELTFAYGNDFLVSDLVVFFNLAEHGDIPLNLEELALKTFLLEQGLIRERFRFMHAVRPNAVILSVPQEREKDSEPAVTRLARLTILTHEISHAVYYTDPSFRNWCRKFWREIMSKRQRSGFRLFLSRSGYDANNESLMINETQAYLLYTPDPRAFNPSMVGISDQELQGLRNSFLGGFPDAPMVRKLSP